MSAKVILVLCAQALFIQSALSSCLGCGAIAAPTFIAGRCAGNGLIGNGYIGNGLIGNGCAGNGLAALEIFPTSGGGFSVSSASTIAPSGLSVVSENAYSGDLSMAGELPFVSAVALEGVLSSAGAGAISNSCGNGYTAIESIAPSAAAYGAADAYGLGAGYGPDAAAIASAALGLGYGGRGCGYY